jgi:cytochrome c-type biogenesis protein CcmH/NrfF
MRLAIADTFQTAAVLTWALPILLLAIVGLYWWFVLRQTDLGEELDEGVTDRDER